MVDRYYREIEDVENNIENAMQISSILLKLKGYDNDLSKIGDNENNISSNLSKIGDNVNAIKLFNKNSQDNRADISTNLSKINNNEKSISTNSGKIDNFTQYILKSGKDFEEKYIIEKQIFRFNSDKHFYTIFEKEIEYNFTKNSLLFVKNSIYYKYDNLSNDYYRLQHEYNIYDGDNLIHKYLFNKDTYYDESLDPILHTNEDFCICFKKNYKKIKINLQLHRHNRHGVGNINSEIDDTNENYINIDYVDRNNNEKVDTNTESISSNLGKINTNEENISNNSGRISTNKNDISSNLGKINNITKTIMLKNIFFTDFDSTKELITKELLRLDGTERKVVSIYYVNMEYDFKKDDVIEIDCKFMLSHSSYDKAKNLGLYYDLYDGQNTNQDKLLYRESRRYNQFTIVPNKNRIMAYTKLCYKVKYDIINIAFLAHIQSAYKNTELIINQDIIQNGTNYISIKHYGKS